MNRLKKIISHPVTTIIIIAFAIFLLLYSSVGGARAALTYYSETYASQVEMRDIGVTLVENDNSVTYRDYISETANAQWDVNLTEYYNSKYDSVILSDLASQTDDVFIPGYHYDERIQVKNSGVIDEYVRVTLYKYWVHIDESLLTDELIAEYKKQEKADTNSNKTISDEDKETIIAAIEAETVTTSNLNVYRFLRAYNELNNTTYDLDNEKFKVHGDYLLPSSIELNFVNLVGQSDGQQCWIEDTSATTLERSVFYYRYVLGEASTTPNLTDTLTVNYNVTQNTLTDGDTTIITYGSDGYYFVVEAEVDAVQDHNAKAAIMSAWGVNVSIDDESKELSLGSNKAVNEEEVQDETN